MRLKSIAVIAIAALLALAPQVFAFGGGGRGHGGGAVAGTFDSSGASGIATNGGQAGSGSAQVVTPEPLVGLLVGLGLLGARYLRRR
ncbi:MAG TPA: hypothetical protein VGV13_08620 [Methylomirabilota bacterium]|jgi:hypothetical protein|nr:hypothetical protein [Methylomirabilota bacterium]